MVFTYLIISGIIPGRKVQVLTKNRIDKEREMSTSMINQFFVVTMTSVYEVSCKDGNGVVTKKMLRGESEVGIGIVLPGGPMVSIGRQIIMFIPEGGGITSFNRQLGMVNTRYWGGNTSPVVALFLTEKEAVECFNQKSVIVCDPRWLEQTKNVLTLIGDNHPVFSISNSPELALVPSK